MTILSGSLERITGVAMRFMASADSADAVPFVVALPRPARHTNLFLAIGQLLPWHTGDHPYLPGTEEQGFVTNTGRFVSRREAMQIALKAGQIGPSINRPADELFSEDVW